MLSNNTVNQLKEMAREMGLEFKSNIRKADLIAIIESAKVIEEVADANMNLLEDKKEEEVNMNNTTKKVAPKYSKEQIEAMRAEATNGSTTKKESVPEPTKKMGSSAKWSREQMEAMRKSAMESGVCTKAPVAESTKESTEFQRIDAIKFRSSIAFMTKVRDLAAKAKRAEDAVMINNCIKRINKFMAEGKAYVWFRRETLNSIKAIYAELTQPTPPTNGGVSSDEEYYKKNYNAEGRYIGKDEAPVTDESFSGIQGNSHIGNMI